MRQVWILNHYAQEPGGVGGTRHFHIAEHLRANGWRATLIAASVGLNGDDQRLSAGEQRRYEYFRGVPFLWVRTPKYAGSGIARLVNMLTYSCRVLSAYTTSALPRPDVVIGSSVHPFAAVAAAHLAHRFRVPFLFEVRDLWPQTLIDMGRLKEKSLPAWILRSIEAWLYRRAARIIVLLPRASEYIKQFGIPEERVVHIPNGVEISLFPRTPFPVRDPSEPFTLMYFGAHGRANALGDVLRAMKLVQDRVGDKRIRLRLIGDGPLKPALLAMARDLALANVGFEDPVVKVEVPALAAQADAFIITVLNLPGLYQYGISMNKIFDYLAAERPVLIASEACNNPVMEAGAGVAVRASDPCDLADSILSLASAPTSARHEMGRNGREYVEKIHAYERLSAKFARVLDEAYAQGLK